MNIGRIKFHYSLLFVFVSLVVLRTQGFSQQQAQPCGINLESLSQTVGERGDIIELHGKWGDTQGTKRAVINKGDSHVLEIISWTNSVIKARIPTNVRGGTNRVGVYCDDPDKGSTYSTRFLDFRIEAPECRELQGVGFCDKSETELIELLSSHDRYIRLQAVKFLGDFKPKAWKAVPALVRAIYDEDSTVREQSAYAIKRIGRTDISRSLIVEGIKNQDATTRLYSILALGLIESSLGDDAALVLGQALSDSDIKVRHAAAWAFSRTQGYLKAGFTALVKALDDDDRNVRMYAVLALEKVKTVGAFDALAAYRARLGSRIFRGTGNDKQNQGERKWIVFEEEYFDRLLRQWSISLSGEQDFVALKGELLSKYLKQYKIYTNGRHTFAVRNDGEITSIGNEQPLGQFYYSAPDLMLKESSDFISMLGFKVNNAADAIDLVLLRKMVHTHDVKAAEPEQERKDWRYDAKKIKNGWSVSKDYIGKPCCIIAPPHWEVIVDHENQLKAIREIPAFGG